MIESCNAESQGRKRVEDMRGDLKVGDKVATDLDFFIGFIGKIIEVRFDIERKLALEFGSQLETVFLVDFGNGERLLLSSDNLEKADEEEPLGYCGTYPKWEGFALDGTYYKRIPE